MKLPKLYDSKVSEEKWQEYWSKNKIYAFDKKSKNKVYSVDTPPPTISGKLHIGHAFSYTQQDFVVRYMRMAGNNVFYPFGIDNNGIATERLVEKLNKVKATNMDRKEFISLCMKTLKPLVTQYINDMKKLGMSCDWDILYETISDYSRKISQKSFLDLHKIGRQYRKDAPTMWCPHCQTAVSQVEAEDNEIDSHFLDIIFKVDDKDLVIATTRPEYLPACCAIFYHPDDKRYKKYKGKKAKVPIFNFEVPILEDKRADPEKGTGIVMCCTFGDQTDMEWYMAHNLPNKVLITKDGKLTEIAGDYKGLNIHDAREKITQALKENKLLLDEKPLKHAVKIHERCKTELEIISTKQWFIKYLDIKNEMIEWGSKLKWYPKHMRVRYDNWIKGLQWDWCISRQRYFGIPIPAWYCEDCEEIILPKEDDLPVDPIKDKPPSDTCPKCKSKNIIPDKDVLDTWATSSLSPQIVTEMFKDEPFYDKLYPMTMRPQAHDIITFWLFNTVVKSQLHNKVNPWRDVVISGHAQDPHGKKMSKSVGNVIEPFEMIDKYSADALRFWAAGSKLGDDMPFQEKDLFTGQKMIVKLWNASKFALMHLEDYDNKTPTKISQMDKWILSKMHGVIKESTETFEKYEYSKTKAEVEKFFWNILCDNYLEIVKGRLYRPEEFGTDAKISAQYTLYEIILSTLKMIAPIMPFITDEIYHLYFDKIEKKKSIHISSWPKLNSKLINDEDELIGDIAVDIIGAIRRYKSDNNLSLKSELSKINIRVIDEKNRDKFRDYIKKVEDDIKMTMNVKTIKYDDDVDIACNRFMIEIAIR